MEITQLWFLKAYWKVDGMVNKLFNPSTGSLPVPRRDKNERNHINFVYNLDVFAKWLSIANTLCLRKKKSMQS